MHGNWEAIGVACPQCGSGWKHQSVITKIQYRQTDDDNGS